MIALIAQNIRKVGTFNFFIFVSFMWEHGINKLVVMPFLARHLGEAKFGSFVLAMSVVLFFATLIPSGIFMTNYRENANFEKKERQEFFDTILTLLVIVTTVFAVFFFLSKDLIGRFFDSRNIEVFVPFLAVYLVCYVAFNFGKQILAIDLKFKVRTIFDVIYGSFICLLIPGFFIFGDSGVSAGYFIGSLVAVISILYYLKSRQLIHTLRIVRGKIKLVLKSTPAFTFASLAMIIMTVADRWIVGAFWPELQVTYYYVGVQIAALFVLPFSLLNSVLNPIVTKRSSLTDFKKNEIRLFLFAIIGSVFFVFMSGWFLGPWVIKILYGQRILTYSRLPFYIILVGQVFHLFKIFSQPFITKFFPPNLHLNIQWVSVAVFIVLHLFLVPRYGIIGGAIASASAFTLLGLLYFKVIILRVWASKKV